MCLELVPTMRSKLDTNFRNMFKIYLRFSQQRFFTAHHTSKSSKLLATSGFKVYSSRNVGIRDVINLPLRPRQKKWKLFSHKVDFRKELFSVPKCPVQEV